MPAKARLRDAAASARHVKAVRLWRRVHRETALCCVMLIDEDSKLSRLRTAWPRVPTDPVADPTAPSPDTDFGGARLCYEPEKIPALRVRRSPMAAHRSTHDRHERSCQIWWKPCAIANHLTGLRRSGSASSASRTSSSLRRCKCRPGLAPRTAAKALCRAPSVTPRQAAACLRVLGPAPLGCSTIRSASSTM